MQRAVGKKTIVQFGLLVVLGDVDMASRQKQLDRRFGIEAHLSGKRKLTQALEYFPNGMVVQSSYW